MGTSETVTGASQPADRLVSQAGSVWDPLFSMSSSSSPWDASMEAHAPAVPREQQSRGGWDVLSEQLAGKLTIEVEEEIPKKIKG